MALARGLRGLVILLSILGFGCGYESEEPDGVGGAAPGNLPRTAAAPTLPPPELGDEIDGGIVVSVTPQTADCNLVTLEFSPQWECSQEQIEAVQQGTLPTSTPTTTPASEASTQDAFQLEPTDCDTFAEQRRPVLKSGYLSTLFNQRRSLLSSHCFPTRSSRYIDALGNTVSYCPRPATTGTGGSTSVSIGQPSPGDPNQPSAAAPSGPSGQQPSTDPTTPAPNPGESSDGATDYSTTNTQVAGVDEADFVKNDGEYVYVLTPGGLQVIRAWPAEETERVAQVPFRGEPLRMFLDGDRLVVYTRLTDAAGYAPSAFRPTPTSSQGCTYGYTCRFSSEGGRTGIVVIDVSEPEHPRVIKHFELSGGFVAARRVGPNVYTVVYDQGTATAPALDVSLSPTDAEDLEAQYQDRIEQVETTMDELPSEYFLPWVVDLGEDGTAPVDASSCDSALASRIATGTSFVSLVAFDLEHPKHPTRTLSAMRPGFVYGSASALYLASDGADGSDTVATPYTGAPVTELSTIHKFSLDGTATQYVGSQTVPGHVLNQFSMDERDGVLRVATSSGWVPNPAVVSNITTLAEDEEGLSRVGELTGLAPQEDIRSVRFDGDRGFVVTFKKTDPLFVIDLSDAERPSVLGELKIPGFSTYMHRLDEDHLLAVGFDADDQGSFAYFDGIQIQIFDVSDLADPLLLHKTVIGTRGSGSEALLNHLAFNYFAARQTLALPVTVCEGGDNGIYGDNLSFSGLVVFDVSLEDGITERGRMSFLPEDAAVLNAAGTTCGQWWSSSTSLVKRSIFMDDFVYGLSDTQLRVAGLDSMDEVLASVGF